MGQQQYWSAENATNAYLQTLQMGKRCAKDDQPDVSEFISAIAAGNNAQLMVMVCGSSTKNNIKPTAPILALIAAAQYTGGHVVCIFSSLEDLQAAASEELLMNAADQVPNGPQIECVLGDARRLLAEQYRDADFILVDCADVDRHEEILQALLQLEGGGSYNYKKELIFLGYNAFCNGSWKHRSGLKTQLLPIGKGLLVTRIGGGTNGRRRVSGGDDGGERRRKGKWVVTVDEITGEEHVFRVKSPRGSFTDES